MPQEKRWRKPWSHSKGSIIEPDTKDNNRQALYNRALRLLARRSLPTIELRKKLLDLSGNESLVLSIIQDLDSCGYLDDRKFIETFVHSRRERRHFGRARVEMELRQKGLNPGLVAEVLEQVYPQGEDNVELEKALTKKLKALSAPIDAKKAARLYNYLLRQGFSADVVYREIRRRFGEINPTE